MSWELTMAAMLTITGGAAMYVAWPLLAGRTEPDEFFGDEPNEPVLQRLLFQRDTTYAAMKELEFDLAMGNLSQQDFDQLQERYKRKAVAILKWIDDARAGRLPARAVLEEDEGFEEEPQPRVAPRRRRDEEPSIDLDVEQEIEAFRRKSRGSAGGGRAAVGPAGGARVTAGPASTPRAGSTGPSFCPSCGRPVKDPEAAFCSKCGAPLRKRVGGQQAGGQPGKKSNRVKGD